MLINDSSTWAVFGSGQRFNSFEGYISVLTCRKYESTSHVLSMEVQPGDLESTRLDRSDTSMLSFLATDPDTHPAKRTGGTPFYCRGLRKTARKGKHLWVKKRAWERGSPVFYIVS